jgi:methyl-accepting chemotaxis protein
MTTKLEAMVGYLAGRDTDPALLDELRNPSSDANGFLEATRTRSRALLEEPAVPEASVKPAFVRPKRRNWLERVVWASAAVLALGLIFWVGETRSRRLEAVLERASNDVRTRSGQIEAALNRLAEANSSAVATLDSIQATTRHLETDLGQLDGRVQKLANGPEPVSKPDPLVAGLRDQLATLLRELTENKKTSSRQVEELQASIHDVARQIKLLRSLSQSPEPVNEPPPRRNP